jgi:hypothetical protein
MDDSPLKLDALEMGLTGQLEMGLTGSDSGDGNIVGVLNFDVPASLLLELEEVLLAEAFKAPPTDHHRPCAVDHRHRRSCRAVGWVCVP